MTVAFDPASFRDPAGRLFRHQGAVYRTASPDAVASLRAALDRGLLHDLESSGCLLPVTLVRSQDVGVSAQETSEWLIQQREIPFVTYSYEWSFSMLRDAALVTLRALHTALAHGFVLKDASSFNIVFEGTVPRLVDVHPIERRTPDTLWAGYAQFCRAFLFPLFLASHRGIDPGPLLVAGVGEIGVDIAAALFRWRDKLRPGVFTNVSLQA